MFMSGEDRFDIRKAFGRNVRKRRVVLGLSQEGLAERADLHRTYIGDIERGLRNVSLINIWKIANALELSVHELVRVESDEEKPSRRLK